MAIAELRLASDLAARAAGVMSPYPMVANVTKLKYTQLERSTRPSRAEIPAKEPGTAGFPRAQTVDDYEALLPWRLIAHAA